ESEGGVLGKKRKIGGGWGNEKNKPSSHEREVIEVESPRLGTLKTLFARDNNVGDAIHPHRRKHLQSNVASLFFVSHTCWKNSGDGDSLCMGAIEQTNTDGDSLSVCRAICEQEHVVLGRIQG